MEETRGTAQSLPVRKHEIFNLTALPIWVQKGAHCYD